MPIALVTHTSKVMGVNGGTTTGIDTSGANLLVVAAAYLQTGTITITDSKSNTWTALTTQQNTADASSRLWYCKNPTVGSAHTITFAGLSEYSTCYFASFSGCEVASPFDVQNGAKAVTVSTLNSGSITPGSDGELVISACGAGGTSTTVPTVSLLTIIDAIAYASAVNYGGGLAYEIQTTATARNPLWTFGGTLSSAAATIASFKAINNVTRTVSDTLTLSDGVTLELDYAPLISDILVISDSQILNLTFTASLSETEVLSDAIGNSINFIGSVSDSLSLLDGGQGFGPGYAFTDSENLTDSVAVAVKNTVSGKVPIWHLQSGLSGNFLNAG